MVLSKELDLKEGSCPKEAEKSDLVSGIVEGVFVDEGFARALKADPETVLSGIGIRGEEYEALCARNPEALRKLGVEDPLAEEFAMATVRTHHPRCSRIQTMMAKFHRI